MNYSHQNRVIIQVIIGLLCYSTVLNAQQESSLEDYIHVVCDASVQPQEIVTVDCILMMFKFWWIIFLYQVRNCFLFIGI